MSGTSISKEGVSDYVVTTDLPPNMVSAVGIEIFKRWLEFALGQRALGGKAIMYPTGRYAASLQYQETGEAEIAIIADSSIAPEASILETGHGAVDLKTKLTHGRVYPMHRRRGAGAGGLLRIGSSGPVGFRASIWARARRSTASGFASIGPNSPADSWIIPVMPAYSPAMILANMAASMARQT